MAACLPPDSAGPGQVATQVRLNLTLSPWPILPPWVQWSIFPQGRGLGWPELSSSDSYAVLIC